MYVCICKNVTEGQIRKAVKEKGINSVRELRRELGVCDQCGKCALEAQALVRACSHKESAAAAPRRLKAA